MITPTDYDDNDETDSQSSTPPCWSPGPPTKITFMMSSSSPLPPQPLQTPRRKNTIITPTPRVGNRGCRHPTLPPASPPVRIAIDMRTRSSRLFFVLLHLVGVSTKVPSSSHISVNNYNPPAISFVRRHRPSWLTWSAGIVGVQPSAILLERLDVGSSRRGLKGVLERVERVWGWDGNTDLLGEPYWFQDNVDGLCLGPGGGFSDCGDATLWSIKRKPLTKRQLREKRYKIRSRRRLHYEKTKSTHHQRQQPSGPSVCVWPFFCEQNSLISHPTQKIEYDEVFGFEYNDGQDEKEELGFALQLTGVDAITANLYLKRNATPIKRRFVWNSNNDQDLSAYEDECLLSFPSNDFALQIGSCSSDEAWAWHINRDGILVRQQTKTEKRRATGRWSFNQRRAAVAADGNKNLMSSQIDSGCIHRNNSTVASLLPCDGDRKIESLVGFSLVRYPSTSSKSVPQRGWLDSNEVSWEPWTTLQSPLTASSSASPAFATVLNKSEQHLPTSRRSSVKHSSTDAKRNVVDIKPTASMLHFTLEKGKSKKDATTSASHVRDAALAMNGVVFYNQRATYVESESNLKRPSFANIRLDKSPAHVESFNAPTVLHHRPRKIPSHPYIQSSHDFVWVDPLTSLQYPTDLSSYLGHTKQEVGRHTLMGVGQYYKTAFNIKVYGAALYVARRDVLADPKFGEYALLSSDDLRARDDFYEHLMNMPFPGEDPTNTIGGFFDRTLFIKTNMQLSMDVMRKSLESDWKLLTDEMKNVIINSSFKERMADDSMKQKILSKENSSNCSCGQSAPPEFDANPTCCARGTELVFTWRKNGNFEIRLDGRVMDVFPRPDIAKGIFWEYLNNNPISLDAKAHFADGFPFLLAPLAQAKGMTSTIPLSHEESSVGADAESTSKHPMHRLLDAVVHSVDVVNHQAHSLFIEISTNAQGVARVLGEELDKHREDVFESALALQKEGIEMLSNLIKLTAEESGLALAIVNQAKPRSSPYMTFFEVDFGTSAQDIISDEIGVKIEPSMNFTHSLFFTTVHIYLLLLFVVSIPCSIKTRLVKRRMEIKKKAQYLCVRSHEIFLRANHVFEAYDNTFVDGKTVS